LAAGDAMKSLMPLLPRKKAVALDLLERTSVFVHLDPRRPGVIVPAGFTKQPQLVLQIGLNMAISIPDLDVTEEGITCTLSFNKRPQFCSLPWSAIYALIGEQGGGMVWPEDVPPEVVSQQQSAAKKETRQRRPGLRAVGSSDSADRKEPEVGAEARAPRSEPPEPELARRDSGSAAGVKRASSRPPRLGLVAAPQPAKPEPAPVEAEAKPDSNARPHQDDSASKRARPPYLRLVD
jgi:stringent starvation protein B